MNLRQFTSEGENRLEVLVRACGSIYICNKKLVIVREHLINSHFVIPAYAGIQENQAPGFRPSPE